MLFLKVAIYQLIIACFCEMFLSNLLTKKIFYIVLSTIFANTICHLQILNALLQNF